MTYSVEKYIRLNSKYPSKNAQEKDIIKCLYRPPATVTGILNELEHLLYETASSLHETTSG